jgi:hypothetical protein
MRSYKGMKAMRNIYFFIAGIFLLHPFPPYSRGAEIAKSQFVVNIGTYTQA